jgi:citrate synthase
LTLTGQPIIVRRVLVDVPRGLKGVVVTETKVGDVRGEEGFYHYRQYSAVDLAQQRRIEDVWQLMIDGSLPSSEQQAQQFRSEVASLDRIPTDVQAVLPLIAKQSEPLDGLRTAISLVGAADGMRPNIDLHTDELRHQSLRLAAVTPVLLCALHRLRSGLPEVPSRPELGYAANYLWMLTGAEQSNNHVKAIEQYLISTIDHGFNASTFTARVIASTGADFAACVTGAIGSLSGPLHGGAPSRALALLDEIQTSDRIDSVVRPMIARGDKIMGFGHPVYRTADPRSVMLRGVAQSLAQSAAPATKQTSNARLVDLAIEVEQGVLGLFREMKPNHPIHTNVEFFAGVVMELCGVPRSMFTPTFASSRVIGWTANMLEQVGEAKIIRPSARYVGPAAPEKVPNLPTG